MILLTFCVWAILIGCVVLTTLISGGGSDATAVAGLIALGLGVVLPAVLNYWRPLVFRWPARRRKLRDALLSKGILTPADLERTLRFVWMREVQLGTERTMKGTRQPAFLLVDGGKLKIYGEQFATTAESFRIIPGCTGRCSRCVMIWACGGDDFRVQTRIDGQEREFLMQCAEGRSLRAVARSTEMLEDLVDADARAQEGSPSVDGDSAAAKEESLPAESNA